MNVLVLGAKGMLGSEVVEACKAAGFTPWPFPVDITRRHELVPAIAQGSRPDVVINCAGVIASMSPARMAHVNAYGAQLVAEVCRDAEVPLIHVSTDCVYYDDMSNYGPELHFVGAVVQSPTSPTTLYGRTKLAGEPDYGLVVRTSFVGPRHGLWAWAHEAAEARKPVDGWAQAYWSGSTVDAVATSLVSAAGLLAVFGSGYRIVNLATALPITKLDVLQTLSATLGWGLVINPVDEPRIDRSMTPSEGCVLPSFQDALLARMRAGRSA